MLSKGAQGLGTLKGYSFFLLQESDARKRKPGNLSPEGKFYMHIYSISFNPREYFPWILENMKG